MSTAHNIPNLNTFVCTHPVWTKAICSIQSTNTFIKIKISSKNWYLQAGNYCCGWFGRVRSFFNTLEFISIFWDQKNVCSLNLTWCFVQMPCALAHRLVEQPKKYCCVRFKICWPGHSLTWKHARPIFFSQKCLKFWSHIIIFVNIIGPKFFIIFFISCRQFFVIPKSLQK